MFFEQIVNLKDLCKFHDCADFVLHTFIFQKGRSRILCKYANTMSSRRIMMLNRKKCKPVVFNPFEFVPCPPKLDGPTGYFMLHIV